MIGIFDAKIALDKSLQAGRDELAKKEEKEYEALNKELNDAFQLLNNAKQQGQQLQAAASTTEEVKETPTTDNPGGSSEEVK